MQLEAERQAFEALNSNDDMNPSLREGLESRDREYLRISAQRNATETAIEARAEADRKRLVANSRERPPPNWEEKYDKRTERPH